MSAGDYTSGSAGQSEMKSVNYLRLERATVSRVMSHLNYYCRQYCGVYSRTEVSLLLRSACCGRWYELAILSQYNVVCPYMVR